jgi:hypothetical protein
MSNINSLMKKLLHESLDDVFDEVYAKWGGDKRIDDEIATELQVPVFAGERLKQLIRKVNALMERQEELPLDNIWRVELRENDKMLLTDFTMPSSASTMNKTIKLNDAPKFIQEGLAVLQITSNGSLVENVGKRISDSVYYIMEKVDGEYPREEGERCD